MPLIANLLSNCAFLLVMLSAYKPQPLFYSSCDYTTLQSEKCEGAQDLERCGSCVQTTIRLKCPRDEFDRECELQRKCLDDVDFQC